MLINEVCRHIGLTKKAVEYYCLHELVSPALSENGYRDFSLDDVQKLKKIKVLRNLDISADDIRKILADETLSSLQEISVRNELRSQRENLKNSILKKLIEEKSFDNAEENLRSIEISKNISERLLEAFPGYYGRFIALHFGRFLNEPIKTDEQKSAYDEIISFLDNLPEFEIPKDLNEYLIKNTENIGTEQISAMLDNMQKAYENPDKFFSENKEFLEEYIKLKQSDEHKNSPAFKLNELIRKFNSSVGYNDVFIPAMKRLSQSYAEYYCMLEDADKRLRERFPQINNIG